MVSRPKWKLVPVKEFGCSPNSGARAAEMKGGSYLGWEKCIYLKKLSLTANKAKNEKKKLERIK